MVDNVQRGQASKNILLAVGLVLLLLFCIFMVLKKAELSAEDIVIGDIGNNPVLSLYAGSWGKTRVSFIMCENGQVIWHNDRSPTGYLIAQLSTKEQQELTALAQAVVWGKNYSISSAYDDSGCTIKFQGQMSTVYGGLANTSNFLGMISLYLKAASSYADSKTGIKNVVSLPPELLQLYNRLSDFGHANAKPWLPAIVLLSIRSIEPTIDQDIENRPAADQLAPLPAGLPAVKSSDISPYDQTVIDKSLGYRTYLSDEEKKHIRQRFANYADINYYRRLDANEYKKQIVQLLKISRQSDIFYGFNLNQPVAMAGQACRFSLNVDDVLAEELLDPKLSKVLTMEARKHRTKAENNPRKEDNHQNDK
jgi:hypothetical protein